MWVGSPYSFLANPVFNTLHLIQATFKMTSKNGVFLLFSVMFDFWPYLVGVASPETDRVRITRVSGKLTDKKSMFEY